MLFVRKRIVIYAGGWIALFFKIFAGIRWLCNRKRHNFVIYYTYSLTSNFSYFFFIVLYLTFGYAADIIDIQHRFWYELGFLFIESICLQIHMRYIDKIHFAKNDLAKDLCTLHQYRDHLTIYASTEHQWQTEVRTSDEQHNELQLLHQRRKIYR